MHSIENQQQLRLGYLTVSETYLRLMMKILSLQDHNAKSTEYLRHGFLRRLGILQRCIQNVYQIYPVERADIPSRDEILDLTINLQSFVFSVFGSVDNLAWVWVIEKQLKTKGGKPLQGTSVSFKNETVNQTLPAGFRAYLKGLEPWFGYIEEFRHALAHRIPLYIPPHTVSPADSDKYKYLEERKNEAITRRDFAEYEKLDTEQIALAKFTPGMTHSHTESSGMIAFHAQVLADWNTIAEIADKFLSALAET